ncbi:MAG TPA: cysteine desulfurase family protein [Thermoanaerobaculia bacterium]|nr:cysteine desulfurase family protein [Thermoanaerobaculia bacterium]
MAAVYLDHNATTPLDPRVREAMLPWLGERHGNPSSLHAFGQAAKNAVEEAREKVAALLGARPPEIVFCASGTEANNAVLFDLAFAAGSRATPGRIVTSGFEHPSVREAANRLGERGFEIDRIAPRGGTVDADEMIAALEARPNRPPASLVALMLANNELGTIQPVGQVAYAARALGVPVLCDAVQAVGKMPVSVVDLDVDALVLGGHKFHGPLGAAALWLRKSFDLHGYLVGGSQERRRRASTENVPAIVGLGAAAEIAARELPERHRHLAALRDRIERGLSEGAEIPEARIHCADRLRLPNTTHIAFSGVEGEALLIRLDLAGFAVSTGSACSSGTVEPSKGMLAAGFSSEEALSSLRVSVGITNTEAEIDAFLGALAREVAALRRLAPVPVSR